MTTIPFLAELYERRGGIKLGLGRIAEAFSLVKRREIPVYHVAGTNGKGTVVYATSHLLRRAGFVVGSFVSPHIVDFNERILRNGEMIPDDTVIRLFSELEEKIPIFEELSFFEVTFLLAWRWWEESGVERAVVEVGLGGRLDATNVIDWPKTDLIPSIGLDHTQILGDTREKIAAEKLGIVHRGDLLFLGPTIGEPLLDWMQERAQEACVSSVCVTSATPGEGFTAPRNGSFSPEQIANLVLAHGAVSETEKKEIIPDFEELFIPGRFQRLFGRILIDVAHNPPAIRALADHVRRNLGRVTVLFGAMRDKEIGTMLSLLGSVAGELHVVSLRNAGDRGAEAGEIVDRAPADIRPRLIVHHDPAKASEVAIARTAKTGGELLVCGSFFLLEAFLGYTRSEEGRKRCEELQSAGRRIE